MIYLDKTATKLLDPTVFEAITPNLLYHYSNLSAKHKYARETQKAIEQACGKTTELLNFRNQEIVFNGRKHIT